MPWSYVKSRIQMNNTIREAIRLIGLNVVFIALLVLFTFNRDMGDPMMSIVIPLILVTSAAIFYTVRYKGDMIVAMCAVLLLEIGQMTQVLINEGASAVPVILLFVSPFFGAGCVAAVDWLKDRNFGSKVRSSVTLGLIGGCVLMITLILLAAGRNINGTKAWIFIGSLSLQLTELFKPLYVLFHAVLWSSSLSHRTRFISSVAMTLGSAGLLLIINELGTLLAILLMWIILTFIYITR